MTRCGAWHAGAPRPSHLAPLRLGGSNPALCGPGGWEGPPRKDLIGRRLRFVRNGAAYHPLIDLTDLDGECIAVHADSRVTLRMDVLIPAIQDDGTTSQVPLEVTTHLYNLALVDNDRPPMHRQEHGDGTTGR